MENQKVGDPMLAETNVPPLSSAKLVDEIHGQVEQTIADG
jgi:acyl-CoA reductase-like NAD-dependent aldehyde dehydrogenase